MAYIYGTCRIKILSTILLQMSADMNTVEVNEDLQQYAENLSPTSKRPSCT